MKQFDNKDKNQERDQLKKDVAAFHANGGQTIVYDDKRKEVRRYPDKV